MSVPFLGLTSAKQRIESLAQGHNAVLSVRLEPAALNMKSSILPLSHWAPGFPDEVLEYT